MCCSDSLMPKSYRRLELTTEGKCIQGVFCNVDWPPVSKRGVKLRGRWSNLKKGSEEAMCKESWEEKYTEEKRENRRGDEEREEGWVRGREWDSGGMTPASGILLPCTSCSISFLLLMFPLCPFHSCQSYLFFLHWGQPYTHIHTPVFGPGQLSPVNSKGWLWSNSKWVWCCMFQPML